MKVRVGMSVSEKCTGTTCTCPSTYLPHLKQAQEGPDQIRYKGASDSMLLLVLTISPSVLNQMGCSWACFQSQLVHEASSCNWKRPSNRTNLDWSRPVRSSFSLFGNFRNWLRLRSFQIRQKNRTGPDLETLVLTSITVNGCVTAAQA